MNYPSGFGRYPCAMNHFVGLTCFEKSTLFLARRSSVTLWLGQRPCKGRSGSCCCYCFLLFLGLVVAAALQRKKSSLRYSYICVFQNRVKIFTVSVNLSWWLARPVPSDHSSFKISTCHPSCCPVFHPSFFVLHYPSCLKFSRISRDESSEQQSAFVQQTFRARSSSPP